MNIAGTLEGSNLSYEKNNALDLDSTFNTTIPDLDFAHARVQADTKATFVEAGGLKINEFTAKTTYADQKLDFSTHIAEAPSGGDGRPSSSAAQREPTGASCSDTPATSNALAFSWSRKISIRVASPASS